MRSNNALGNNNDSPTTRAIAVAMNRNVANHNDGFRAWVSVAFTTTLTYLLREPPNVRPGLRGIDGLLGAGRGAGAALGDDDGRFEPLPNVLPL